ncbi:hypothetical protein [Corynebacterium auriscanis]|uniref:hypothetical protein n=1 Tax=Corynebacterium auriscanis TaxID=99807 RepID=UPI0022463318|nr:hypothetical protein [Corynebacterium auriscanis]MCX2162528.1 hypothetical protein [Corynebacterium auriscanis]
MENKAAMVTTTLMGIMIVATTAGMAARAHFDIVELNQPAMLVMTMALGSFLYFFSSVVLSGTENPIEPEHFGALPLRFKDILPGMLISTLVTSRGVISALNTLIMMVAGTSAYATTNNMAASIAWPFACLAQLLVTIVIGEACYSMIARIMHHRGWRELITTITSMLFILSFIGMALLANAFKAFPSYLLTTLSRWSPFGAAAGAAAELSHTPDWNSIPRALACVVIWAVAVVIFIALWTRAIEAGFRNPIHTEGGSQRGVTTQKTTSDGRPPLMNRFAPNTQWGAIFSRGLLYWVRDNRLFYSTLTFPMLSVVYLVMGFTGNDSMLWIGLWMPAFSAVQLLSNVYGYDGPSNWLHIVAGVRGKTMVTARMVVGLLLASGLWIIVAIAVGIHEHFSAQWFVIGLVSFGAILGAMALGAFMSVVNPYPTSPPGINPMRDRSGGGGAAFASIFGGTVLLGIASIPGLVMTVMGTVDLPTNSITEIHLIGWVGLVVHFLIMAGILWLAVRKASSRLDAGWPKIFYIVKAWK